MRRQLEIRVKSCLHDSVLNQRLKAVQEYWLLLKTGQPFSVQVLPDRIFGNVPESLKKFDIFQVILFQLIVDRFIDRCRPSPCFSAFVPGICSNALMKSLSIGTTSLARTIWFRQPPSGNSLCDTGA
jgi:hypothetical protein